MTDPIETPSTPAPTEIPQEPDASFSTTIRLPRWWRFAVIGASGLILLVSAALAFGASPGPSSGSGPTPSAAADSGAQDDHGFGPLGLLGPGGRLGVTGDDGTGRGRPFGAPFGRITIAAINGSSVSLKTDDGWTRTITIASTTTITKGGKTIAASELAVGDAIGLRESRQSDGSFSIDAIVVLVPQVAGSVSAVTSDGFTLKTRDGTTWTITVTGSTTYRVGDANGTKADVKTGVNVVAAGTTGSAEHSLTALSVQVRLPAVFGQVTAKSGNTLTIKQPDGTTQSVHVASDTTYRVAGKASASLADISVGMKIIAHGTQRSDGSLDARSVVGGNGRGLPGFGPFPFGLENPGSGHRNGPDASSAPSTSGSQG